LKKLVTLFSFTVLATYSVVFACVDWFIGYDEDSSFTPEVYADASYSPLFFSSQEPFYRINYDTEHRSRFNSDILYDWSEFLKGKVTAKDLNYLLLSDSAGADIDLLFKAVQSKKGLPPRFASLNVADEKVRSFITFMHFAKVIEACSMRSPYSWDYEETTERPLVEQKTIDELTKLYTVSKDPFLKNRYWFQVMKASFYGPNQENAVAFFEKTKTTVPENLLYYRALSYVAGVHYTNKRYAISNYIYSIVFDKCPALRVVATYNFRPMEGADFKASLEMAKTADEKSALWALLGFYLDEKQAIQEIYKLNPKSEHLDYLLTRMINKKEVTLNAEHYETPEDHKKAMKALVAPAELQFVIAIAKDNKINNAFLWNSAAGYLQTFAGNYAEATQYLDKAAKASSGKTTASPMASDQIRLLRLINTLCSINKIDGKTESKLVTDLTWLYQREGVDTETLRTQNVISWSRRHLATYYKAQKNTVMAELFHQDQHFYSSPVNVEGLKAFLSKTEKSPWEAMAARIYSLTLADIHDYQGVLNAYNGKFDEAIRAFTAANSTAMLPGNPFNGKIKDCHDCDHAAPQKVKYTKLSLVQKMKEMQEHVTKGEDVYNNSLLLANAYYNIGYFGNARAFYYGNIIDQGSNYIEKDYQPMVFDCAKAKALYQKAFDAAANDEQKAKCVYMMAKCERNEFYAKNYHSMDYFNGEPEISFLAWDGFKQLKGNYAHTKYYKDVIHECGYFEKFVEN
jgi:tetratricopeptide (TPR) repeat protein